MQVSKYDPLRRTLEGASASEVMMTFGDVEKILGFRLPPSARSHRVWWSNNPGTNVAVRAWREAGRKTARVDMSAEKVVFVKDEETQVRSPSSQAQPNLVASSDFDLPLSPAAAAMIEKQVLKTGRERAQVMADILHEEAIARRKRALAAIRESLPKIDITLDEIVEMIREDRDSR